MEVVEHVAFRVTRDADFEVSDEADDLLEAVEQRAAPAPLRRRRAAGGGQRRQRRRWSQRLNDGLGVLADQVYAVEGMLDLADLSAGSPIIERPELRYEPWLPVTRARLAPAAGRRDLFAEVRRADLLVHLPYDSFATSVESFVRAAAKDRDVVGAQDHRLPHQRRLGDAAGPDRRRRGRQADRLPGRAEGALRRAPQHRVVASDGAGGRARRVRLRQPQDPRQDDADRAPGWRGLHRYAHIGTGNYNAVTARLYEDFGLFTDDEAITADLADLFNHLTGFGRPQRFRKHPGGALQPAKRPDRAHPGGRAGGCERRAGADQDQGQRADRSRP